ncbi:hypothetical protein ACFPYJ_01610 [Paenibacillus solisilvae]|uniref:Uncharacterized protein n=1 Tax=Paenibacillus solisilvae TaxID=2486751 RepID=A0ABW0VTG2_9BACL
MENKTARELLRQGYPEDKKQKQEAKTVEPSSTDVENASAVRLLSWGYKKLLTDNADSTTD